MVARAGVLPGVGVLAIFSQSARFSRSPGNSASRMSLVMAAQSSSPWLAANASRSRAKASAVG